MGVAFLSYFSLDWIIEISQFLVSIGKTLDEALLRRSAPTYDTIKTGCKKYLLVFFFKYLQVVLSMVVVHLHESDYVAADNCYKNSFEYVIVNKVALHVFDLKI